MADAYGLDDFSLLSGPQQDTARMVQKAFNASQGGLNRNLQRYNLNEQTSQPLRAEFFNDAALRRAQVTAGILNQNQQLQNVIDASHRTPHGFMENLAAYAPAIGGLSRLYPMLFGTGGGSVGSQGLIPSAYQGAKNVVHWFTGSDGTKYGLDANGNVVSGSGMQDFMGSGWGQSSNTIGQGANTVPGWDFSNLPDNPPAPQFNYDWSGYTPDYSNYGADLSNWFG